MASALGGTGGTPTVHRDDLEQARLDMESYAAVIIQLREDYLAFLHQADQYLAAATILRGEDHQEREEHK